MRTRSEILNRIHVRLAEASYWESRVIEFGENSSRDQMLVARGKANELTWMLESQENA